jgi:hypothetical protein
MKCVMTELRLRNESETYRGSGGTSEEGRSRGFEPAFLDTETELVYPSCFADGRRAPCHLLDGLPDELVSERRMDGRVAAVKASIISGFVRHGRFFTRDEAASMSRAEQPLAAFA